MVNPVLEGRGNSDERVQRPRAQDGRPLWPGESGYPLRLVAIDRRSHWPERLSLRTARFA